MSSSCVSPFIFNFSRVFLLVTTRVLDGKSMGLLNENKSEDLFFHIQIVEDNKIKNTKSHTVKFVRYATSALRS